MRVLQVRAITGPNIYHHLPVLVMQLELGALSEFHSAIDPEFKERLLAALPGLASHHCSPGRPGGFLERLDRGTYLGHIVEHAALELSSLAGIGVNYGKTIHDGAPGVYRIVVRYLSKEGMEQLLRGAVDLLVALVHKRSFDVPKLVKAAEKRIADAALGPSTMAIVDAAERQGIPWLRLNEGHLIQFGYGKNRRLIQATATDRTGFLGVEIAQDKEWTKQFLRDGLIRVPQGRVVSDAGEAVAAFHELGVPVALKPKNGNQGNGVSLNLKTDEEVAAAYAFASKHHKTAVVEEHFVGRDYRVLVVGGKMIAASERVPAHVLGDGKRCIAELVEIENENPLRGDGHAKPLSRILLDELGLRCLERRGLTVASIPAAGETVFLRETANLSTGGSATDVTEELHPEVRATCERAARLIGLDVCGIDLVLGDIGRPLGGQRGGIIEVNAAPGIRMHHYPSKGKSRDAGKAILDQLFPSGSTSRIPIVAVTGTNGKTTVARLIAFLLSQKNIMVGLTTTDGIQIGSQQVSFGDTTGPASAQIVLSDPGVEVAVLETARGGIVKRGLGFDRCDVAVFTNIQPDHIGQDGIESIADVLHIKKLLAERLRSGGALVLNADDPLLTELPADPAVGCNFPRLVYFSQSSANPVIRRHLAAGGTCFYLKDGWLCEGRGPLETPLVRASAIPMSFYGTAQFQLANVLAALSVYEALGNEPSDAVNALLSFQPNSNNRGRGNIYRIGRGFLLVDYAHNPDALQAIGAMISHWGMKKLTGVIAAPGDRSDELIRHSGEVAARSFDKLLIREDADLRGRPPRQVAELILEGVKSANPELEAAIELGEEVSLERAWREMTEDELIVYFYDDYSVVKKFLSSRWAQAVDPAEIGMRQRWLEAG